ncbi:MAG TPA: ribosome biogenesis GTP-binding protein YihA/YsxC [Sphingobium sp.]
MTPEEEVQAERIEDARRIFAGPITFLKSAPQLKHLPDPVSPEVAFAGRSNVGKSSLINALCGRNSLARTSNTPGRTQELNFFDVAGSGNLPEGAAPLFRFVDMPGYGYAKAPKDVVRQWRFLINDYLRGRAVLKRVLVLVDCRHGLKEVDNDLLNMLDEAAVSYRIVLTKTDKVKASELAEVSARTAEAIRKRPAAHPEIIMTSSEKGMGIPELRAAVIEAIST